MFYKFGVYIFLGSGLFLWGGVVFGGYTSRDVKFFVKAEYL